MEKHLTLTNHISQTALLPPFVEELCEELCLNTKQCFNLNLVLEEAVTNVINYAYSDQQEHRFTVDASTQGKQLVLTLTDDGCPFDPTEVPPVDITVPAEERQIGGLGIFLIRQLMDEVRYERRNDQNVFTMITSIEQQPENV